MRDENPITTPEPNLTHELIETASTLARLGTTLAALPIAMLPRQQRVQARQMTSDLLRFAAAIPRAVGSMFEEAADEWQGGDKAREDLGSRLRRLEQEEHRATRYAAEQSGPNEDDEQLEGEAEATEEVEEAIQETMEMPPVGPDEDDNPS
jgi:hypothetical protein